MPSRLAVAMICYAMLAIGAGFMLGGPFRILVWVVLAGFAVKTWIASKREAS